MIRYFLMMALLVGGLSVYGQQASTASKPACSISQCQARKTAATTTTSATAPTAMLVSATSATAPERATAPTSAAAETSCASKMVSLPLGLSTKAMMEGNSSPQNCVPKNCNPSACLPGTTKTTSSATTLAVRQE